MTRISEKDVVIPALKYLSEAPGGELLTTDLIEKLVQYFKPEGEDAKVLKNRNDMRFTQIVRNLKSHETLEKEGWAVRINDGFRITDKGRAHLAAHS